jgi:hypothetical protein
MVLLAGLVLFGAVAAGAADLKREDIEWCDVWMPHLTGRDLPRVLLIGDSITRGYFDGVEKALAGKAYVARVATSKSAGDPALVAEVAAFLSEEKFDVVHFNNGMHGWAYTEAEYRAGLRQLLKTIRKGAPRARLVWATTTPVGNDRPDGPSNSRIDARNAIARELFSRERVPEDDLHALMQAHPGLFSDGVHFQPEGIALQARQVADAVSKALEGAR